MHKFIGIPYFSLDCYDLIRYFYSVIFSIDLPNLEYDRPNGKTLRSRDINSMSKVLGNAMTQGFVRVTKPMYGDIILLRIFNMPIHVGIYLNEKQFLHTQEHTGSCVEKIKTWEKRILGYYRYDQV